MKNETKKHYGEGLLKGVPIGLGYIPVSFSFGFMAVSGGLPVWMAVFISMSNLTSAGQFAGTNLIFAGSSYIEISLTTFIINLRYMLMSLSLSQKLERGIPLIHKLLFSFGITDETFAIASLEEKNVTAGYMYGLITAPFLGWTFGTLAGACSSKLLPPAIKGAMGIALFAMFIAIFIPAAKKSLTVIVIIGFAILISCILKYCPLFSFISDGFRIIITTIFAAGIGALLFPEDKAEKENNQEGAIVYE